MQLELQKADCVNEHDNNTCLSKGVTYETKCHKYKCMVDKDGNDEMRLQEGACVNQYNADECLDLNDKYQEGCVTYECRRIENAFSLQIAEGGCTNAMDDNKCIDDKATYETRNVTQGACLTYTCVKGDNAYNLVLTEQRCANLMDDNKCVPENGIYEFTNGSACQTYRCKRSEDNTYKMEATGEGCENKPIENTCLVENKCRNVYGNGECLAVDKTWRSQCATFQCVKSGALLEMSVTENKCQDAYGGCHDHGENGFGTRFYRTVYRECSCTVDGLLSHIYCTGGFRATTKVGAP